MKRNGFNKDNWELNLPVGTTFIDEIIREPLPNGFKMPALEPYGGNTDLIDHLQSFKSIIVLHGVLDVIMCQAFPTTQKRSTRTWCIHLKPRMIKSFKELSKAFAAHFATSKNHWKTSVNLMAIKQHGGESFREFLSRFNKKLLEVRDLDPSVTFATLLGGIKGDKLQFSLSKKPLNNLVQLLARCEKYINAFEAMNARKDVDKDDSGKKRNGREDREAGTGHSK